MMMNTITSTLMMADDEDGVKCIMEEPKQQQLIIHGMVHFSQEERVENKEIRLSKFLRGGDVPATIEGAGTVVVALMLKQTQLHMSDVGVSFFCPNGDILCRVGDMSPTRFGHVADTRKCRVGQGVQNDTTCRLFPTCR